MAGRLATCQPAHPFHRPEFGSPSRRLRQAHPLRDEAIRHSDCNTTASELVGNYPRMNSMHVQAIATREIVFPLGQPFAHWPPGGTPAGRAWYRCCEEFVGGKSKPKSQDARPAQSEKFRAGGSSGWHFRCPLLDHATSCQNPTARLYSYYVLDLGGLDSASGSAKRAVDRGFTKRSFCRSASPDAKNASKNSSTRCRSRSGDSAGDDA